MSRTCFVIMAIGEVTNNGQTVTAEELRSVYENFLRPAIHEADSSLEITRADVVTAQGTITTDILTRLMYSDIVVADITHPNPNVFYELGIRHACKPGTIILRDKDATAHAPFDVSHQRYISYEPSLPGKPQLVQQLKERLSWFKESPATPDNHLLEHAKNSKFNFPQYGVEVTERQEEGLSDLIEAVIASKGLMDTLVSIVASQPDAPPFLSPLLQSVRNEPDTIRGILRGLVKMGVITPEKLFSRKKKEK